MFGAGLKVVLRAGLVFGLMDGLWDMNGLYVGNGLKVRLWNVLVVGD